MTQESPIQSFDPFFSGTYVTDYPKMPLHRLSRLLPYFTLSPTDCVVDYACGPGMLLEVIHEHVGRYVGVDFSSEFIDFASKRALQFGFRKATFEFSSIVEFALRNRGKFDKAFTLDFGEFLSDDDFRTIFKAVRQSLKPGGILFYHEPNGAFFLERLKDVGLVPRYQQLVAIRTASQIEPLLKESGFEDIRVTMLSHYLKPLSYLHALSKLPWVGGLFEARLFLTGRRP